jgi:hypothetical protein
MGLLCSPTGASALATGFGFTNDYSVFLKHRLKRFNLLASPGFIALSPSCQVFHKYWPFI